jgi:mobilome CxxCx(11)CxxC protein
MNDKDHHDRLRQDCWNYALHSYGYAYTYSLRSEKLNRNLNIITFLGILIPVLIGGIVTTYGLTSPILKYLLIITAPLSIVQLIISVWSVVANWNTSYAYYLETSLDNYNLSSNFEKIGKYPPQSVNDLKTELEKVIVLRENRDKQDNKYPLNEIEKRRGMRYSLRKHKRSCAGCNIIPVNMDSSDCGVCGKF